ncbi:MAG: Polysaccharide deacetylase [Bacteroidetes bacterium]|nr:Polysaccharide deacetylase [Bacteroidota bacterium]
MLNLLRFFQPENKCAILMYHHVGPVTDENERKYFVSSEIFQQQLKFLKENKFYALKLEELEDAFLYGKKLPENSVLITLDDGWLDNYQYAYSIAKENNIPITIFLSTALIGKDNELLTWDHVREMHGSGIVSFSSHGAHHKRLRDLSDEDVFSELADSKQALEAFFARPVVSFCYPFGAFDKRVRRLVLNAGYQLDFGTRKGINSWPWKGSRPLLRAHVYNGESLTDYANELTKGRK